MKKFISYIKSKRIIKIALLVALVYVVALILFACSSAGKDNPAVSKADYPSQLSISVGASTVLVGTTQEINYTLGNGNAVDHIAGDIHFMENSCDAQIEKKDDKVFITPNKEGSVVLFITYTYYSIGSYNSHTLHTVRTNVLKIVAKEQIIYPAISTIQDLSSIERYGFYTLTNDIDCGNINFKPIDEFDGYINGNGYAIKNMRIDTSVSEKLGFIRTLKGRIDNMAFENCYLATEKQVTECGIIAGVNNGTISNCHVSGGIQAAKGEFIGGIVGRNLGSIIGSSSNVNVKGDRHVGGIAGFVSNIASVKDLNNFEDIYGAQYVGGLFGEVWGVGGNTEGLTNGGTVNGSASYVGGIAGYVFGAKASELSKLANSGTISGASYIGGIFGYVNNAPLTGIASATNHGKVSGTSYIGGIVGQGLLITVYSSENDGAITGQSYIGGLAGEGGTFWTCMNSGNVKMLYLSNAVGNQYQYLGGIAGKCSAASECSNSGKVDYSGDVPAIIFDNATLSLVPNAAIKYVGGIAGYAAAESNGNTNNAKITGRYNVGGIFGVYAFTKLDSSKNTASVTGLDYVAGIASMASTADITNCQNSGAISGATASGIVCEAKSVGISSNSGAISCTSNSGGIVGTATSVSACDNSGAVIATGNNIGGVVGNATTVTACGNTALISGKNNVGGIAGIGTNVSGGTNSGAVSGAQNVGGIAGLGDTVADSKNNGIISGGMNTGGIVGDCKSVSSSENSAKVTATAENVGGIAGRVTDTTNNLRHESNTNRGAVSGTEGVGGIFGYVNGGFLISDNNLASGSIAGTGSYVGGCFGKIEQARQIQQCINRGDVEGWSYVGGVIGVRKSTIADTAVTNCANYGKITVKAPGGVKSDVLGIMCFFVTYDYQGATSGNDLPTAIAFSGSAYTLAVPQRTGYTFGGWYETIDGDDVFRTDENGLSLAVWSFASDKTLKAKWTANAYYVGFDINGGTVGSDFEMSRQFTFDETAELGIPSRTGYDFGGWYAGETQVSEANGICVWRTAENVTLTAKWIAKSFKVTLVYEAVFRVTFNLNGAEGSAPATQVVSSAVGLRYPEIPTRSGYIFGGWYDNAACAGSPFDFSAPVTQGHTLYAKWLQPTGYTDVISTNTHFAQIYFNQTIQYFAFVPLVSGNVTIYSVRITGIPYGYLFNSSKEQLAFHQNPSGSRDFSITHYVTAGELYYIGLSDRPGIADYYRTALYVVGTAIPSDGGVVCGEVINVTYDGTFAGLSVPTYEGHFFAGWFTEPDGAGEQVFATDTVKITENITLYAKFEEI